MVKTADNQGDQNALSLGVLLTIAASKWKEAVEPAFLDGGVSVVQGVILESLRAMSWAGETVRQVDLARETAFDVMTISKNVRALEKKRLVKRIVNVSDSRAWNIELTKEGTKLADVLKEAVSKFDDQIVSSKSDAKRLRKILTSMVKNPK